jgi:GT2 family glycosyltransferase
VSSPSLAVVLPTHDRHERLARCLDALAAQDVKPDEIVVVDDASNPPVKPNGDVGGVRVTLLRNDRASGAAASRNRGWRATSADYVAFTDDDCRPSPGWIRAIAAALRPDAVLVGRTVPDPEDGPRRTPLDRSLQVEDLDLTFPTANVAFPRAALERLGGFDEEFLLSYGEDTDLGQRALAAGLRAEYLEAALVHHAVHRQTLREAIAERRRVGELARLTAMYPHLRDEQWEGVFWNGDHRVLVTAAASLLPAALALRAARRSRGLLSRSAYVAQAGAALLPSVRYARWCRRRALELDGDGWVVNALTWFALDAVEVALLAAGSVRYRSLLL